MECGVMYIKVIFPKNHKLEWINYTYISNALPKKLKDKVCEISGKINSEFIDDLVINLDDKIHPGCATTPNSIQKVSERVYGEFVNMIKSEVGDVDCVRCAYTVGDIPEDSIKECESIHKLYHFPVMIKLGRYIDSSKDPGIFKI